MYSKSTKNLYFTLITSISLMLTGCASIAVADIKNCVPLAGGKYEKSQPKAKLLDEKTTKMLMHQTGKKPKNLAVVFTVDRDGNMQAFIPKHLGNKKARLCDFDFPLRAGKIKQMSTLTTFSTTNPKVCWRSPDGFEQCIVW